MLGVPSFLSPHVYESGDVAAFGIAGEVYPLAWWRRDAWAGLGFAGSFFHSAGLSTFVEGEEVYTALWAVDLDLIYRWRPWATPYWPEFVFHLGFGTMDFAMEMSAPPLPNVSYSYLRVEPVDVEEALYVGRDLDVSLRAFFTWLIVLDVGDIARDNFTGDGTAGLVGMDLGVALRLRYRGFFGRLAFAYRRITYDFDGLCVRQGTACVEAAGALEEVLRLTFLVGYAM